MPWIAETDDGRVTPEQVEDGVTVTCPDCGEDMHPRGPTIDGKARHFVHSNGGRATNCQGGGSGESDTHRRMKSQVISAVSQWFDTQIASIEPEAPVDVTRSASRVETRYADVHVEFDPPHPVIGEYLAVEVQYKNHSKAVEPVTHDYIVTGRSVYWATVNEFSSDRFHVDELVYAFHRTDTPTIEHLQTDAEKKTRVPSAVAAETVSPLQYSPLPPEESTPSDENTIRGKEQQSGERDEFEVQTKDGDTVTLPSTVEPESLYMDKYEKNDEIADAYLVFPDEEVGLRYASRETHPPAKLEKSVPRTTQDGHPIPQIPDCNHQYNPRGIGTKEERMWSDTGIPCEKCGEPLYLSTQSDDDSKSRSLKGSEIKYYFIARPYRHPPNLKLCFKGDEAYSSGETQVPYCGDRIWRVDFDADEYQCTTCGRRFPRSNEALRNEYGSTDIASK
jgi:predicted RNA-binding Zn-ribbon protein involved in translation (DUF1610 family)